jgi:predicted membrane chloride channel (bestrophin family)
MLKAIKRIGLIINYKTFVLLVLSVLSTYFCNYYHIKANFPLTLIATAIVFPIVFSIGGAYKRRESALDQYGNIKAHGRALFFAVKHWLPETSIEAQEEAKVHLAHLLSSCRSSFTEPLDNLKKNEIGIYESFDELSMFIKSLRDLGLPSGEASRANSFLSKMMVSFEKIKHIYQYRTPRTLRTYSQIFIIILPIIYGPYFAVAAESYSACLIYAMPILFSVILVSLDNIQMHLENPFDQVGEDDVEFNVEKFIASLK